jgi:SecD/SecF fusion protein
MQRTAIIAVFTALGAMFIYIAFRFRDVKIGGATIAKLLVNVLVLVGFYAIFRITLNNSFIIAILTVLGYSVNDTIVLFDRLRENRKLLPNMESGVLINKSVSQTLTRSIYTTVSTLFAVVCLIIFGVYSIREFAVPIMLGIAFGMYTSVCLAGSFLHVFNKHGKQKKSMPSKTV